MGGGLSSPKLNWQIVLNVYDATPSVVNSLMGVLGGGKQSGLYRSGIEFAPNYSNLEPLIGPSNANAFELSFSGGGETRSMAGVSASGVQRVAPRSGGGIGSATFREAIVVGSVRLSRKALEGKLAQLTRGWTRGSYDLLGRNSNHFSDEICRAIAGRPAPEWVNCTTQRGSAIRDSVASAARRADAAVNAAVVTVVMAVAQQAPDHAYSQTVVGVGYGVPGVASTTVVPLATFSHRPPPASVAAHAERPLSDIRPR